jgi:hypothetical protein
VDKQCPYCGENVAARWHIRYGLEKIERGVEKIGVPIVGVVKAKRQILVMVYICDKANLPFLVVLPDAK